MKNNGTPRDHDAQIADIREILQMTALQTAENAKQIAENAKQIRASREEHDREMKEIRVLFKAMIKRIAI
jgi:DNA-binding transcriptional MerR regulator